MLLFCFLLFIQCIQSLECSSSNINVFYYYFFATPKLLHSIRSISSSVLFRFFRSLSSFRIQNVYVCERINFPSSFLFRFCVAHMKPLYHKHKMMKRTKERKKKNNTKQNKMMIRSQCRRYFCVQYAVTCIQSLCISRQIVSSIMLLQKHQVERTKFHLTSSMKEKREMIRIQTYKCVCMCVGVLFILLILSYFTDYKGDDSYVSNNRERIRTPKRKIWISKLFFFGFYFSVLFLHVSVVNDDFEIRWTAYTTCEGRCVFK